MSQAKDNSLSAPETGDGEVEEWRPVPSLPGIEVSNLGRVLSRRRYPEGRLLRPYVAKASYQHVSFRKADGRGSNTRLHLLVLEAFVGPRPPGMWGCHYDGDPSNNRLENLRWDTPSANILDSIRHGTRYQPDTRKISTREAQLVIAGLRRAPATVYAEILGVRPDTILALARRRVDVSRT